MSTIEIPHIKRTVIVRYCHDNISPRRYYLHNCIGGVNWSMKPNTRSPLSDVTYTLEAPPQHLLLIALKYGIA